MSFPSSTVSKETETEMLATIPMALPVTPYDKIKDFCRIGYKVTIEPNDLKHNYKFSFLQHYGYENEIIKIEYDVINENNINSFIYNCIAVLIARQIKMNCHLNLVSLTLGEYYDYNLQNNNVASTVTELFLSTSANGPVSGKDLKCFIPKGKDLVKTVSDIEECIKSLDANTDSIFGFQNKSETESKTKNKDKYGIDCNYVLLKEDKIEYSRFNELKCDIAIVSNGRIYWYNDKFSMFISKNITTNLILNHVTTGEKIIIANGEVHTLVSKTKTISDEITKVKEAETEEKKEKEVMYFYVRTEEYEDSEDIAGSESEIGEVLKQTGIRIINQNAEMVFFDSEADNICSANIKNRTFKCIDDEVIEYKNNRVQKDKRRYTFINSISLFGIENLLNENDLDCAISADAIEYYFINGKFCKSECEPGEYHDYRSGETIVVGENRVVKLQSDKRDQLKRDIGFLREQINLLRSKRDK